jgi:hypothetical protein
MEEFKIEQTILEAWEFDPIDMAYEEDDSDNIKNLINQAVKNEVTAILGITEHFTKLAEIEKNNINKANIYKAIAQARTNAFDLLSLKTAQAEKKGKMGAYHHFFEVSKTFNHFMLDTKKTKEEILKVEKEANHSKMNVKGLLTNEIEEECKNIQSNDRQNIHLARLNISREKEIEKTNNRIDYLKQIANNAQKNYLERAKDITRTDITNLNIPDALKTLINIMIRAIDAGLDDCLKRRDPERAGQNFPGNHQTLKKIFGKIRTKGSGAFFSQQQWEEQQILEKLLELLQAVLNDPSLQSIDPQALTEIYTQDKLYTGTIPAIVNAITIAKQSITSTIDNYPNGDNLSSASINMTNNNT